MKKIKNKYNILTCLLIWRRLKLIMTVCIINQEINRRNLTEVFGTIPELFKEIKFEKITLEDAESKLVKFDHRLDLLENTVARKEVYKNKKAEVIKSAESLLRGQKLIYSGFVDNIFTIGDKFVSRKQVTLRDKIPDFEIRKMFEDEEKTPKDMPDLESE